MVFTKSAFSVGFNSAFCSHPAASVRAHSAEVSGLDQPCANTLSREARSEGSVTARIRFANEYGSVVASTRSRILFLPGPSGQRVAT